MTHLGEAAVQRRVRDRIASLQPSNRARWGKMNAGQMLCHLTDSFLLPLGEKEVALIPMSPPQRAVMKFGALYVPLRWPRDLQSTPEVTQGLGGTPPEEFEADRTRLIRTVERFCDPRNGLEGRQHPFFASLTRIQWLRWGYLHADHHLRQFGA